MRPFIVLQFEHSGLLVIFFTNVCLTAAIHTLIFTVSYVHKILGIMREKPFTKKKSNKTTTALIFLGFRFILLLIKWDWHASERQFCRDSCHENLFSNVLTAISLSISMELPSFLYGKWQQFENLRNHLLLYWEVRDGIWAFEETIRG